MISLRGVRVHNLKNIDLDLPRGKLIVFCGPSGSGKTSLALDTLYAEGQRRYIESFSPRARQFLERIEKPAAERIDGIPPAIAVTRASPNRSTRATVGTATEIVEHLRLLYARIGQMQCTSCGRPVRRDTPESIAATVGQLPPGLRVMIAALASVVSAAVWPDFVGGLVKAGFTRIVVGGETIALETASALPASIADFPAEVFVVVDRLKSDTDAARWRESIETALAQGNGRCALLFDEPLRGHDSRTLNFTTRLECPDCGLEFEPIEPRRLSFDSPLGACATCEGFGTVLEIEMDRVVPDAGKSIRDGAIAPWNVKSFRPNLEKLLEIAADFGVPVDEPYHSLDDRQREIVQRGVPERGFDGLAEFFNRLQRRKNKEAARAFLNRYRTRKTCPACLGQRLRPEALAVKLGGLNLAELSALRVGAARRFLTELPVEGYHRAVAETVLTQITSRLAFLGTAGLSYLTLDRSIATLSTGEFQRVSLTSTLGSSLVNMLYVFDEPTAGLHASDVENLVGVVEQLVRRGNTVVAVEHEEAMLRAAEEIVELGPAAGERGGTVVFQGSTAAILAKEDSVTGQYLTGRRGASSITNRRGPQRGSLRLVGARGNNLQNLTVDFPLGVLCVVTGVSGAGKSTLVEDTLYPALCRRLHKPSPSPLDFDDVLGAHLIEDVLLVDQTPIGRSPRSNPVTYIKAFDEIRAVFAETVEARTHNLTPGHFSFNVDGGRCTTCQGDGYLEVDMQFLADVFVKCPQCQGRRYRPEILKVKYRGVTIAEVLEMTVREAFTFFRGQPKAQQRLRRLIDVGLDYLRLGQPANTLSGGESQRLKLAAHLTTIKRGRSLFILDEPTTGLHFSDIGQLLDCFASLIDIGHSLIVIEHNLQVIRAADHVIDLGPGAAEEGGRVVAVGTPEEIMKTAASRTGQALAAGAFDARSAQGMIGK